MKIDKGVPVPNGRSKWHDLIKQMAVGDSIVVESRNDSICLATALRKSGFDYVTRTEEGGIRVWKIFPKEKFNDDGTKNSRLA